MQRVKLIKGVKNLSQFIADASEKTGISADFLEVKIVEIHNFIKHQDIDYFKEDKGAEFDDDELFENKDCEFSQTYDIILLKRREKANFSLEINDNFESVNLALKKNFRTPKDEKEFDEFFSEINSLKAINGVILRKLGEEKERLKNALNNLKKDRFEISRAPRFRDSKEARLGFSDKFINNSKKNIICVAKDSEVCEFLKEEVGISGRNLAGKFITPSKKNAAKIAISSDFEIIDGKVKAKESGFVIFENSALSFKKELSFNNLQTRDNCYFCGNLDSETSLVINTQGEFLDALKEGVFIKANKITINGNIAAHAKIEGKEVIINGQTHKDSDILAQNAKINVHRGKLIANMAHIENLENGEICAIKLELNKINGGNINGEEINISELYSNASIKFSKKCEIFTLKGGNNKIVFSALANKDNKTKEIALNAELSEINKNLKIVETKLNKLINQYNKYQQTAKNLESMMKNSEQVPDYVRKNYNAFLSITQSIKNLKKEKLNLKAQEKRANDEITAIEETIYEAELICKEGWLKYNDIIVEARKNGVSKTIIKGCGLYRFDKETQSLIHKKIFKHTDEKISNKGF